jgi:hypothetical protein
MEGAADPLGVGMVLASKLARSLTFHSKLLFSLPIEPGE